MFGSQVRTPLPDPRLDDWGPFGPVIDLSWSMNLQSVINLDPFVQKGEDVKIPRAKCTWFCIFVFMRFFFVFLRAARRGEVVGKFEQLMGVLGCGGWLRLVEPDEIYIRNYSRKFGRPARNIKDPGIFPSRLYTVQFESIILLNIQWNFFLNTLPTSVTLLYVKLKRGFQGNYARFLLSFKCYQWSVSSSVVFVFLAYV